jgi:antitoxin VapB
MPTKYRATLFTNGGSQAVRLPKECRLDGKVVEVWRDGARVIIEPVEKPGWPEGFWEAFDRMPFPADFERPEDLPDQAERAVGWNDEPPEDS